MGEIQQLFINLGVGVALVAFQAYYLWYLTTTALPKSEENHRSDIKEMKASYEASLKESRKEFLETQAQERQAWHATIAKFTEATSRSLRVIEVFIEHCRLGKNTIVDCRISDEHSTNQQY